MSVTINIEFSDAQWELIKKHHPKLPNEDGTKPTEVTTALMSIWGKDYIQQVVLRAMEREAVDKIRENFNV